jgi:hypothetical protein
MLRDAAPEMRMVTETGSGRGRATALARAAD